MNGADSLEIKGERIRIKKLKLEDIFLMRKWGFHETPLLEDYNFPKMNDREIKVWYRMKTASIFNKYYGIRNEEGKLIGYMGIKKIKYLRRQSTLGIVLDANYVNKGYGTEILEVFLEYYFTELRMKKIELEVADYNHRAKKVYEKIGFIEEGYYLDEFFNPHIDKKDPYFIEAKSSFVIDEGNLYNYIHRMILTKKRFFNRKKDP